jgi:hypothetical protein
VVVAGFSAVCMSSAGAGFSKVAVFSAVALSMVSYLLCLYLHCALHEINHDYMIR